MYVELFYTHYLFFFFLYLFFFRTTTVKSNRSYKHTRTHTNTQPFDREPIASRIPAVYGRIAARGGTLQRFDRVYSTILRMPIAAVPSCSRRLRQTPRGDTCFTRTRLGHSRWHATNYILGIVNPTASCCRCTWSPNSVRQ